MVAGRAAKRQKLAFTKAFDIGINFIDTANVYGRGAAVNRCWVGFCKILVARLTFWRLKFTFRCTDDRGLSSAQIHKQIDASLQRLGTDMSIYQCRTL